MAMAMSSSTNVKACGRGRWWADGDVGAWRQGGMDAGIWLGGSPMTGYNVLKRDNWRQG